MFNLAIHKLRAVKNFLFWIALLNMTSLVLAENSNSFKDNVTKFSDPFSIKLPASIDAAKSGINAEEFTIFNKNNVYRENHNEILELAMAIGENELRKIVSYKPNRLLLHWTAAYLNFLAKVSDDGQFEQLVNHIYKEHIFPASQDILDHVGNERTRIHEDVVYIIKNIKENRTLPDTQIAKKTQEIYNLVINRIKAGEYTPGVYYVSDTIEELVIKLATDELYNNSEKIDNVICTHVEYLLSKLSEKEYEPLLYSSNEGHDLVIIVGAPGSGKSTLTSKIANRFKQSGFATITKDNFNRLLLSSPHDSIRKMGAITRISIDESATILYKTVKRVYQNVFDKNMGMPNSIFEMAVLKDLPIVEDAIAKNVKSKEPTYLYFVYLPMEKALQRAFARAKSPDKISDKDKFLEPNILIAQHKVFGTYFERALETNKDNNLAFAVIDNDMDRIDRKVTPSVIAFGDTSSKELNILDMRKFNLFLKKRFLNINATSLETLYNHCPPDADEQIEQTMIRLAIFYKINKLENFTVENKRIKMANAKVLTLIDSVQ